MEESYDWLFEQSNSESIEDYPESIEDCPEIGQYSENPNEPMWTTVDGNVIPLSKMTTCHIVNSIKLLESKKPTTALIKEWLNILNDELTKRKSKPLERSFFL